MSERARVDTKIFNQSFPGGISGQEPPCQCRRYKRCRFDPWVGKIFWRIWEISWRHWSLGSPAGPGINSLVIGPGEVRLQDALWDRSGMPRFVGSGDGAHLGTQRRSYLSAFSLGDCLGWKNNAEGIC